MHIVDEIDKHLLFLLEKDARQSSQKLARELMVSAATVRRRLNKLIQAGVLRIVGVADPCQIGPCLIVLLALDVDSGKVELAMKSLASNPEVKFAFSTIGRFDIIAIVWFDSTEDINYFLQRKVQSIDGLRKSETFICLTVGKQLYFPTAKKSARHRWIKEI